MAWTEETLTIAPSRPRLEQRMRQFDAEEHRAQIGGHDRVPFFDGRFDQRLGDLHGGVVDQRLERVGELVRLLEDGGDLVRVGDVRLDEEAVRGEVHRRRGFGPRR